MVDQESPDMDFTKLIEELCRKKERMERAIASLERLQASGAMTVPEKKRRGRKFMSPEERQEVSARMKRFWANRLSRPLG
jgi:hypothetical protein